MKRCVHFLVACALMGTLLAASRGAAEQPVPLIHALVSQVQSLPPDHPADSRGWLDRLYAERAYAPMWTGERAEAALAALDRAATDGLDKDDYGADALRRALHDPHADPARFDVALTAAMLHYLADLRLGRVRSEYHTSGPDPRLETFDPVALLNGAASGAAGLDAAEPAFPMYARVRAALDRYRELAREPQPVLPPPHDKVEPGEYYDGTGILHEWLVLLGDLEPQAPQAADGMYTEALAHGVRSFQARHGLRADGVLGRQTVAAINVPLAQRVRQLELTLERLRWLPDLAPGPVVAVNLPSYRLWAFDSTAPGAEALEMRVIVGTAVKTPTPLFVGQMRYLEFNPFWNVPRSITVKEIIPDLERNPGYLKEHGMELVGAGGVTNRVDQAAMDALRAGQLRIRQRPGPKNALGAIKFAMPNPMDIYLHDTPNQKLFERARRDLSHGCIRVEAPARLAHFVLHDQPQWGAAEIEAAMQPGPTRTVKLRAPVPVVIFYATAVVDDEGKVLFPHDVYRRDPLLEKALARHGAAQQPQIVPASKVATE